MAARVQYTKDMQYWSNAVKTLNLDWPDPSSSSTGYDQKIAWEIQPQIHAAIDEGVIVDWVNATKLEKETLENRLSEIEKKMEALLKIAEIVEPTEINIRDISYDQAKKEITEYFKAHHGETVDAADLEEYLGIDIEIAIQVCEELEKEGQIKGN